MRALLLSAPGTFEYREVEPPVAPDGWVRIRMRCVGICGSDVHYYSVGRIGDQVISYPYVLGHECSGEILDGAGEFNRGARVYVEPAISGRMVDELEGWLAGRGVGDVNEIVGTLETS